MTKFIYSLNRLLRIKRSTALLIILTFVLSCAVILSSVILATCDVYKKQNDNPYSEYYRLMYNEWENAEIIGTLPEGLTEIIENKGYTNKDMMKNVEYSDLETINSYFLNITDYYVEMISTTRSKTISPVLPVWWERNDFFRVHAVPDDENMTVFLKGEKVLVDGRFINEVEESDASHVCLISDIVAEKNGVKVGDSISIIDPATLDYSGYNGEYVDFTVVGIYHDYADQKPDIVDVEGAESIVGNCIYIPLKFLEGRGNFDCYNYQIKLTDDSLAPKIEELINRYKIGGGVAYLVKVEEIFDSNNEETGALETIFTVVQYSIIVLSALFMVMYLYSIISARKRECGVLLGLGQTKTEVFAGILIECGICVLLGLILSAIFTAIVGCRMANSIYSFVGNNNDVEAVSISTSDAMFQIVQKEEAVAEILDTSFIAKCIASGTLILIPVFILGFASAAVAIARINVMNLLTKEET